ncbi:hypothetical protein [Anaerotignum sp.]|uniref:hypothetical protein n=1 Tax=Anaerotignum sp. TaxID=2039241 RepID=UPI00289BBB5F|nr:hypothetical protein [Anaerotignum sp.]
MEIYRVIGSEVKNKGVTQTWVVNEVNALDNSINLTNNKLSAILSGKRRIAGEEFIALCRVLGLETNNFVEKEKTAS